MAEKLRTRYLDVLKERDLSLQEQKRIRHDYDLYVKQNDQVNHAESIIGVRSYRHTIKITIEIPFKGQILH